MPYRIAVGRRVLPLEFAAVDEAYRFVLSAADFDPHAAVDRWALVQPRPDGHEPVVPAGRLHAEALRWRQQRA